MSDQYCFNQLIKYMPINSLNDESVSLYLTLHVETVLDLASAPDQVDLSWQTESVHKLN